MLKALCTIFTGLLDRTQEPWIHGKIVVHDPDGYLFHDYHQVSYDATRNVFIL